MSPEASFSQWAWQLLLRLKLHSNSQNLKGAWAVKAGIPIGCYLSIAMTPVGHSLEHFCTDGIGLLKSLIQSHHLRAAVHLLDNILPPTYHLSFCLLNNSQAVGLSPTPTPLHLQPCAAAFNLSADSPARLGPLILLVLATLLPIQPPLFNPGQTTSTPLTLSSSICLYFVIKTLFLLAL
uniref:ectopic P granules protein 5 homolog n=1 Tax=Monopterus albus TaxID=43700 RepID=UPI0009B4BC1C|nr:ectopic P granules protein 5 homolog [Monopterus albus]